MNKHTLVVIGASIIIISVVGFGVWNFFAADQIQFKVANEDDFRFFGLINQEKISFCNTSPFYTNFNNFQIKMVYEGREIAKLNFPGGGLEPNTEITREGKFTTNAFEEVQYLSMHFDGMFLDTIPVRINPTKMVIDTEFQIQIIGIIPVSVTKQYSAQEFWEIMNAEEEYSC